MTTPLVWTETAEQAIDFCVWVLLADGLRVPPFDRHSGGSGALTTAGLTAPDWRRWLGKVVAAQTARSQLLRTVGLLNMTTNERSSLGEPLERSGPPAAWDGSDVVREGLDRLWADYQPQGEAWERWVADQRGPVRLSARDRGRLWRTVDRGRSTRGELRTYLVRYPAPVVDSLPPDTLLVATGPRATANGYLQLLRDGIARLEDPDPPGG